MARRYVPRKERKPTAKAAKKAFVARESWDAYREEPTHDQRPHDVKDDDQLDQLINALEESAD